MTRIRPTLRLVLLALCAAIAICASSLMGYRKIDWAEIARWRDIASTDVLNAFWDLRVPRTLRAAAAGAALSVGGVIFQSLFRNPLASPYTLGVDSGASLGAALGFLLGWGGGSWLGIPVTPLLALLGAGVSMAVVWLMAAARGGRDITRLLLAGVCVAYLSSAGITIAAYVGQRYALQDIVLWMMGSLADHRPWAALQIGVVLALVLLYILAAHRALDLIAMGEDLAAARGVPVGLTVWLSFALVGVLTAVTVSSCGPIGFVGLMVPHMARSLVGLHTLPSAFGAALLGGAFLAVCDGLCRMASEFELPVGVVTNIIGAIFFFYLLAFRDVAFAHHRR